MQFGKTMLAAAVAGVLISGGAGAAHAADGAKRAKATKAGTAAVATTPWTARGGDVGIRWNYHLAKDLGIGIAPAGVGARKAGDAADVFALADAPLQFTVRDGYVRRIDAGTLRARGGYRLTLDAGGSIDLQDFRVVGRKDQDGTLLGLDILDADGRAWFYVDRIMHELDTGDASSLAIPSSDIRIGKALAERIGQPHVADWYIGEFQLDVPVVTRGSGEAVAQGGGNIKWEGTPSPDGGTYQTDLFMLQTHAQYVRCRGCTGENGTGEVAITPSSTLKNNVNAGSIQATVPGDPLGTSDVLWTAAVPWWQQFSGPNQPYGNDQHPFLIWNMYRLAADGSIEQIGRSGVKQAFLTINTGCLEANDHHSHALGRGCEDVYSVGNNDSNQSLTPRNELLPAQGIWARCGGIFDTNCDGVRNNGSNDEFRDRMLVREQQISPAVNPGATYLFESWYLARQDRNIYNSMSTLVTTQTPSGSAWNVQSGQERLGSAIDRWFAIGAPAGRQPRVSLSRHIEELVVDNAHAKVAVKVRQLGDGTWRYDYAVANFDFAFGTLSGTNPNLRVTGNQGFDGFSLEFRSGATAVPTFRDGDVNAGNDWTWTSSATSAGWADASGAPNSLWWGGLYSFTLVSPHSPRKGYATLHASNAPTPASYRVQTLIPGGR